MSSRSNSSLRVAVFGQNRSFPAAPQHGSFYCHMKILLAFLIASISLPTLGGVETAPKVGKFCWPMHYAGVVVGTSQDKHVVKLLGRGAHRPNESDGVRYYIDSRNRLTMKISTFTDAIVGELSLEAGVASTLTASERKSAITKGLDADEGFGNWHALRLGSTKTDVEKNLGRPAKTEGPDAWVYNAECTCELPEYLTVYFEKGKIRQIVFSAPPG